MAENSRYLDKYDPKSLSEKELKEILENSDKIDKEVFLAFMSQVPNLTDLIKSVTNSAADLAKEMYKSNDISQSKTLNMFDDYCKQIYKMCDNQELTFEQRRELLDTAERVLKMACNKDTENKNTLGSFFDKYREVVAGIAVITVGVLGIFLVRTQKMVVLNHKYLSV